MYGGQYTCYAVSATAHELGAWDPAITNNIILMIKTIAKRYNVVYQTVYIALLNIHSPAITVPK